MFILKEVISRIQIFEAEKLSRERDEKADSIQGVGLLWKLELSRDWFNALATGADATCLAEV